MENNLYYYHTILTITDQVVEDPVLLMAMNHLFEWANREGLNGRRVTGLKLVSPESRWFCPLGENKRFRCMVFVTPKEFDEIKEKYKDAWRAWCRDFGIEENACDAQIDLRAQEFLNKIYATKI